MGASPHFFLDEFAVWSREIGPSLDIPIYDPTRLASIKIRRAETNAAVADYRSTLVNVVGEIDAAYINLQSRKTQYASVCREVDALAKARINVIANFKAGLVSQVEVLESERSYWESRRAKVILEEAVLRDHVALVRALGGGLCQERALPVLTAEQVIRAVPVERWLAPKPRN